MVNNNYRFVKYPYDLLLADKWVDDNGKSWKIPAAMIKYYLYRLNQYDYYKSLGCQYYESSDSVAHLLSISLSSIVHTYNPLLKKMGLLSVSKHRSMNGWVATYTLHDITQIRGNLIINKNVTEKDTESRNNTYKASTPQSMKNSSQGVYSDDSGGFIVDREVIYSSSDHKSGYAPLSSLQREMIERIKTTKDPLFVLTADQIDDLINKRD